MDTGDESVVEGANAISCQEEDALTALHCTEEAYANLVSIMVLGNGICKVEGGKNG